MRTWGLALLVLVVLSTASCSSDGASRHHERNTGLWLAMYPVNRVLDVFDIVSVSAGLEGGLLADVHVTRAVQLALGGGGGGSIGWWPERQLGVGADHVLTVAFGPFSAENQGYARAGTAGVTSGEYAEAGLNTPTDAVHQKHRDYWGVGVRVIAAVVGAEFEIHPVEIADLITGFFLVDFQYDDIGNGEPAPDL